MKMVSWRLKSREVETGHDEYIPVGDEVDIRVGHNDYQVTSVWIVDGRVIWVEAIRTADKTLVKITVTPEEIVPISDYIGDTALIDQYLSTRGNPKAGG
jgi:hypothetical protein